MRSVVWNTSTFWKWRLICFIHIGFHNSYTLKWYHRVNATRDEKNQKKTVYMSNIRTSCGILTMNNVMTSLATTRIKLENDEHHKHHTTATKKNKKHWRNVPHGHSVAMVNNETETVLYKQTNKKPDWRIGTIKSCRKKQSQWRSKWFFLIKCSTRFR